MKTACAVLVVIALAGGASPVPCPRSDAAVQAPARAPDVPYEPSPTEVVTGMLRLARVGPGDVVYDLGCGDGRIVIAAVRDHGARGVCVDIDPQRIEESIANARRAGVVGRIKFLTQDLFETDLAGATVVTLFLWPDVNLKLRPKLLRELEAGARIVSHEHAMGDWRPDEVMKVRAARGRHTLYLWRVPAARSLVPKTYGRLAAGPVQVNRRRSPGSFRSCRSGNRR